MSDDPTAPDLDAAALISIDAQCDVLDGGTLEVPGTTGALVGASALARGFRAAGRPIVHIVRLYLPDASNVDPSRRRSVEDGAQTLIAGTAGSQLAPGLLESARPLDVERLLAGEVQRLTDSEVVIYKPRWGAFYRTPLDTHLAADAVSTLVFCGCNFPNCPRTSIYEASERDYRIVLVRDAISGLYLRGEQEIENIGVRIMSVEEVTGEINRVPVAKAGDRRRLLGVLTH